MDQVRAWIKRILSYRRSSWDLRDYPIRLKQQHGEDIGRWKLVPCSAQIINWWHMSGSGGTPEEALADLGEKLAHFRAEHGYLPRPGTGAPVEFASSAIVDRHQDLARDFLRRVLDIDFDEGFFSDETSLWDFHCDSCNQALFEKIQAIYGVDVSSVEGAKLSRILEVISASRNAG